MLRLERAAFKEAVKQGASGAVDIWVVPDALQKTPVLARFEQSLRQLAGRPERGGATVESLVQESFESRQTRVDLHVRKKAPKERGLE